MTEERKILFSNYIISRVTTAHSSPCYPRRCKAVILFLEKADSISYRGWKKFSKQYQADILKAEHFSDDVFDFLNWCGAGRKKNIKVEESSSDVKPLEKLSVISEKNKQDVNGFLIWLQNKADYSNHTLRGRISNMRVYFQYASEFNQENCRRFISTLQSSSSVQTTRAYIYTLKLFSEYSKTPVTIKMPKIPRMLNLENIPTNKEYERMLAYLKLKNKRNYMWIRILATTGMRVSDFRQIKWEDIINGSTLVLGKGRKQRRIFFNKNLQKEVKEYVAETNASGFVATSAYGNIASRETIRGMMKGLSVPCGIPKEKLHPHSLRHFFAKNFLAKNKDITTLQALLGHDSIETTGLYLKKSLDEQLKDFNKTVDW